MSANPPNSLPFFITVFFTVMGNRLQITQYSDPQGKDSQITVPRGVELLVEEIESYLKDGPVRLDLRDALATPPPLIAYPKQLGCETAAYVPILQEGRLRGLVLLGARAGQSLDEDVVDAFTRTIRLVTTSMVPVNSSAEPFNDRRMLEAKALNTLSINSASISDLRSFYTSIHDQIRAVIGNHGFVIALYDNKTNSINIPYLFEDGRFSSMEAFPLGEGLTSILIRTQAPLLLVEDTMQRATAMGAKIAGKPAQSWMGVPLLAQGESIGAIIVQDLEHEHAFSEDDLKFVTSVANQVSGSIYNIRILEESRQMALQFETASEIARDISSSLDLDELLKKATELIRSRFDFYHAAVFLKDTPGEFFVIREATGDPGAQMKRAGHKLAVGSKSVVGYVSSNGEALVVNDTTRDATYLANPLLPDTHSEAAIPLKVGERIVGVLDVQSEQTYAFAEGNLRTLQILADQLAIAVVNSELFAETQEHLAQHRLLHHITKTAASGTTLDEALQSAVNGLQVTLGGDRVSILLADRERKILEVRAAVGYANNVFDLRIPIGSGITGWVAAHRKTLRINNVLQDTRYIEGSPNTRSEMAIPLVYRSELLGVLNVESEQLAAYAE